MAQEQLKPFKYDDVQIGEELGSYEYVLTQEMLDSFRASVQDPDACFPTLAVKHDATALNMVYDDQVGGVNAGNEVEFFNPPIVGKKIFVKGRIHDKYLRRDKPYMVIEATAVDEDGRMLERLRTYQMKKPDEVGKKWHPQS
ncbi:MAG: MaoC family dehydratase [Chloroflexi bacterium]|nr:MaoC family dehydratase [Chloroflexota bacterium]